MGNPRFGQWCGRRDVVGLSFFAAFGNPEILGPDFCPFHTALATGRPSSSTLRVGENKFYQVHAAPVHERNRAPELDRDGPRRSPTEMLQQQKLAAIHQAGIELADLTPDEVLQHGGRGADRAAEVEHPALHEGPAATSTSSRSACWTRDTASWRPLLAVGIEPGGAGGRCSPGRRTTA